VLILPKYSLALSIFNGSFLALYFVHLIFLSSIITSFEESFVPFPLWIHNDFHFGFYLDSSLI